jgi:hypothetical protein
LHGSFHKERTENTLRPLDLVFIVLTQVARSTEALDILWTDVVMVISTNIGDRIGTTRYRAFMPLLVPLRFFIGYSVGSRRVFLERFAVSRIDVNL